MPAKGTTRLSDQRIKALALHIGKGNTFRAACQLTGTPHATFFYWLRGARDFARQIADGSAPPPPDRTPKQHKLLKLLDQLEKAEGRAIARNVSIVQQAALNGTWQAAAWWLERRYPDDFGRPDKRRPEVIEATGEPVKPPSELAAAMDGSIGGGADD